MKIALEDMEFLDGDDHLGLAPEFGTSESNYEEVVGPFYAFWQAYSTKKTYEWLCPYDVREIKERFILRKVEKEMKKIVQAARKDRNEEVSMDCVFQPTPLTFLFSLPLRSETWLTLCEKEIDGCRPTDAS